MANGKHRPVIDFAVAESLDLRRISTNNYRLYLDWATFDKLGAPH